MFEPRPNRRVVSIAVSVLCLTLAAAVRPSTATSAATPFLVGTSSTYAYVDSAASGQAEAFLTTATTTGTVSALRVYVDATAAAGPLTAGLYSDTNSRHPGVLLASGSIGARAVGTWNTITFNATASVTLGKTYWIAVLGPSGSGTFRFRDAQSQASEASKSKTLITLPARWAPGKGSKDGGISAYAVALVVDTSAPSAPTGLSVSGVSETSATLSWASSTDDVGVVGYNLYLNGTKVGTSTSANTFTYSGLTCGTVYSLAVDAYDAAGNLSPAAGTSMTTAACSDRVAPSTPLGVVAGVTGANSASLSWGPSTDNVGVTGYLIIRDGTQVGATSGTSYTMTGLSCATQYAVGVAATDAAGNVSSTATVSFITGACPDTAPPTMPTTLMTSAVGKTSAALSWNTSSDNTGVTGYRLFQNGTQVGTSISTSYIFGGLTCGTSYVFGVAAVDAAGNVSGTATTRVTTVACVDIVAPSTPTALRTSGVGPTTATLTWDASSDNVAVTGYRMFRNGSQVGTSSTTSFTFSGLACGTTYSLGVAALDATGNVSSTAATNVTTVSCADTTPPSTPTGLIASGVSQTQAALSWTAATDNVGVAGYRVYVNGNQVAQVSSSSYTFTALVCATTYTLGVSAQDAAGNTSPIAVISQQTAACSAPSASANWYVSPTGSDANTGLTATSGFATLQRACTAASASSTSGGVIEVAGGSYPSQTVANCAPSSTVTFRPAVGSAVKIAGGTQPWIDGLSVTNDSNLTFQNLTITGNYGKWGIDDSSNIVMQDMTTGRFSVGDGSNISVLGGNYGPYADDQGSGGSHVYPTGQNTLTNLVIDGIAMHDYTNNTGNPGNHLDCLTIGGGNGVTLKNSMFYGCNGYDAWMKGYPSVAGATNVRLVNNVFRPNLAGTPQVVSLACNDAGAPLSNVTVEYNSFGGELNVGNAPYCSSWSNVTVRGNILPQVNPVDCGKPGVSFIYNLVQANPCGSTNTTGATGYVSATDYHLLSSAAAVGRGDPSSAPSTDHDGVNRLKPPDAGAYQH